MNQNSVKTIGINDEPRKDSHLVYVNQADGLICVLDRDFDEWSNFDSWESISVQQWIFSRALEVFRGMKIDIKCDCCEHNDLIPNDFESIRKEKCFGKKSAYMIEKALEEFYWLRQEEKVMEHTLRKIHKYLWSEKSFTYQ